jgi:Family of unknown function (DUF6448)
MVLTGNQNDGPVTKAARESLETGNASCILIWIPEESENTLKNLLERACCARSTRQDGLNRTAEWYFETVNRLHVAGHGLNNLSISTKTPEEKAIILLVQRACESGNFEDIATGIPDAPAGELRQRFEDLMKKRDSYCEDNCIAGRRYVSAFVDFITFVNNLHSRSPDNL